MDNVAVRAKDEHNDWLDCHSHLFSVPPKPISVDDRLYMPGVYGTGLPNEDWAIHYIEIGGQD